MDDEKVDPFDAAVYGNSLDDSDSLDEDEIYAIDECEFQTVANSSSLPMFEDASAFRGGATKTTFQGYDSGEVMYETESSDCSVSIQRLIWVDGWHGQPDKMNKDEAMTLVVLELNFRPIGPSARIMYASLLLKLKANTPDGNDPQLVAWGPFRRLEMWNVTDMHRRTSVTLNAQLSGGGAGQQLEAGANRTSEIEWDERFSDFGRSSDKSDVRNLKYSNNYDPAKDKNKDKGRAPNAVLWEVFENKRLGRGITSPVRVAALFSRPEPATNQKYRAVVKIAALKGSLSKAKYSVLRRIGVDGRNTIKWTVDARPGDTGRCYAEGLDILNHIDPANLGKLVDPNERTNLDPKWLNKWDRIDTSATMAAMASTPEMSIKAATVKDTAPALVTVAAATTEPSELVTAAWQENVALKQQPAQEPLTESAQSNPPRDSGAGWVSGVAAGASSVPPPPPQLDNAQLRVSSRLVDLEKRAALAESRIAEQDQHILQLQQTLNRVAQALLVPSLDARRG